MKKTAKEYSFAVFITMLYLSSIFILYLNGFPKNLFYIYITIMIPAFIFYAVKLAKLAKDESRKKGAKVIFW